MTGFPDRTEAAEYYFRYIDLVPHGDICATLRSQASETLSLLKTISEELSLHRYAADKWTIREVLNHINDTERLFHMRAFWFARGFDTPLPSFDQNVANTSAAADRRPWATHVKEFSTVRAATLSLVENLPDDAWMRRGIASDNPFTVRALAFLAAGHVSHHVAILRGRYLGESGQ